MKMEIEPQGKQLCKELDKAFEHIQNKIKERKLMHYMQLFTTSRSLGTLGFRFEIWKWTQVDSSSCSFPRQSLRRKSQDNPSLAI